MPQSLDGKLVVAVASSALFDLSESDAIFRERGVEAYRAHQRQREAVTLAPGVAFPLVRRLLRLNDGRTEADAPVEVVLMSRNDPDTGLRVLNSIEQHRLPMSRALFLSGANPFRYAQALNASLFLSANVCDVQAALASGLPAGRVFASNVPEADGFHDRDDDPELRVAFDFDGVLADDAAEAIFQAEGLEVFHATERARVAEPLREGPLARFCRELGRLQRAASADGVAPRLRTAIVTARGGPAQARVVTTLRSWGIQVDEAFFLGGLSKAQVLREFRPHIFFDDQLQHIEGVAAVAPCAHVPFGIANARRAVIVPSLLAPSRPH